MTLLIRRLAARLGDAGRVAIARSQRGVDVGAGTRLGPRVMIQVQPGGHLSIGDRVTIGSGTEIVVTSGAEMLIGDDVFIGRLGVLAARTRITIGPGCMLAEMVSIRDHDHVPGRPPSDGIYKVERLDVGRDVWIGAKASLVRRARIGDGAVIGAHALVNRAVPARALAAGVPATVRVGLLPHTDMP